MHIVARAQGQGRQNSVVVIGHLGDSFCNRCRFSQRCADGNRCSDSRRNSRILRNHPLSNRHIHHEQLFDKVSSTRHDGPIRIHHHRTTIKHQLVLPAHLIDIGDGHACFLRPLGNSALTLTTLGTFERRAIDVDTQLCTCCAGPRHWAVTHPDVFTDGDCHGHTCHVVQRGVFVPGGKVSRFIKHRIVRQQLFVIHTEHRTVGAQCSSIEQSRRVRTRLGMLLDECIIGCIHETNDNCATTTPRCHLFQCRPVVGHEPGFQDQIFGWIARQSELGERHEITASCFGTGNERLDLGQVVG